MSNEIVYVTIEPAVPEETVNVEVSELRGAKGRDALAEDIGFVQVFVTGVTSTFPINGASLGDRASVSPAITFPWTNPRDYNVLVRYRISGYLLQPPSNRTVWGIAVDGVISENLYRSESPDSGVGTNFDTTLSSEVVVEVAAGATTTFEFQASSETAASVMSHYTQFAYILGPVDANAAPVPQPVINGGDANSF